MCTCNCNHLMLDVYCKCYNSNRSSSGSIYDGEVTEMYFWIECPCNEMAYLNLT